MPIQEYFTTGEVKDGVLKIRNRHALESEFKRWKDCEVVVHVERAIATRNSQQNALYWAAYIAPLVDYTGHTDMELHRLFKKMFLPAVQARKIVVCNKDGEVVADEELLDDPTTTTLDKTEFSAYLEEITRFAAEHFEMEVPRRREPANSWR